MKNVYLAGAITDCTEGEAKDWRAEVARQLWQHGIGSISPLRCEPIRGEHYSLSNADPRFGTARAIASKNFADVQMCDMILCYMPRAMMERRLSLGTLVELAWAHALRKPTILVSDYALLQDHPVVQACANWPLTTLDEACEVLIGILGDYCK